MLRIFRKLCYNEKNYFETEEEHEERRFLF